ncbi:histidine phosphatase family protein [Heliophilum fasciatum]|nr:histidine phosphatase family protein [Heliophilum fasciatum]MCW2278609.1 broad specificity phosphatase PhoE [Heliophilum fasciatum]
MKLQILFIRHGQTDENIIPLYRRYTIDEFNAMIKASPTEMSINQTGEKQIRMLAEQLRPLGVRQIITSPFRRTRESSAILAEVWGAETIVHDDLGELVLARAPWSGGRRRRFYGLLCAMTIWRHAWPWTKEEETVYQAWRRSKRVWHDLIAHGRRHDPLPIVVVSHLGFLRILLLWLQWTPGCRIVKRDLRNGGLSIVHVDRAVYRDE